MKRSMLLTAVVAASVLIQTVPALADVQVVQQFEDETWTDDLVDVRTLDLQRARLDRGYLNNGLDVTIPAGGYRGLGPYARLAVPADEAWFRYYLNLRDFHPVSSGKFPGLAHASVTTNAKGCKPSTESDPGWSARLMFDAMGTRGAAPGMVPVGVYVYHLDQMGSCGDEWIFPTALGQDRWTCIEGRVKMNQPGQHDGLIEAWMDGDKVFSRGGLAFRRATEPDVNVIEMWDNIYFGGAYPTPNELNVGFDQVVVTDSGRIGCLDPFVDDNGSVHEADLTEVYARELFFGCGERLACPFDAVTRAEFAALLQRVLRPPSGPDAFSDDDGHWAEKVLDSLAAAGIMRGCNPPSNTRACPDAPITRAEVAALVRRAMHLPSGPDAFGDDDGHWAERDINAIAAAGITNGCTADEFCPSRTMRRMEAATFMLRVDDIVRSETVQTQALVEWPPEGPPPEIPIDERE